MLGALRRTSKKTWLIVAVAAAAILLVIVFASCSAPSTDQRSPGAIDDAPASDVSCHVPLACGPSYAGYVPPYYVAHPMFAYLSPYSAFYTPVFNGRSYTVSRTPAGLAPAVPRSTMPYPPGYKPVPGDFQPPTAPKAPAPAPPAVKAPAPVKAPAVRAPAPPASRK